MSIVCDVSSWLLTFQRDVSPPSYPEDRGGKLRYSEMLVTNYNTTRRHNPVDYNNHRKFSQNVLLNNGTFITYSPDVYSVFR
jgi:hypothetical protein